MNQQIVQRVVVQINFGFLADIVKLLHNPVNILLGEKLLQRLLCVKKAIGIPGCNMPDQPSLVLLASS